MRNQTKFLKRIAKAKGIPLKQFMIDTARKGDAIAVREDAIEWIHDKRLVMYRGQPVNI